MFGVNTQTNFIWISSVVPKI